MVILRKIFYYLIGVAMGILIVYFLFGDRNIQCSYFPNDRVLYDLRGKQRIIPAEVLGHMRAQGIDTADISSLLLAGNVDFDKSNVKKDSCNIYWIEYNKNTPPFSAEFLNCDSTATLLQVRIEK